MRYSADFVDGLKDSREHWKVRAQAAEAWVEELDKWKATRIVQLFKDLASEGLLNEYVVLAIGTRLAVDSVKLCDDNKISFFV
jgi:hypothetical protein